MTDMHDYNPKRIPLIGGNEYDGLTKCGKRTHSFRSGERKVIKKGYWQRLRRVVSQALRTSPDRD